ncbi:MAG: hypothetical protein WDO68_30720 [Gammaproteobacteria bacterium]
MAEFLTLKGKRALITSGTKGAALQPLNSFEISVRGCLRRLATQPKTLAGLCCRQIGALHL